MKQGIALLLAAGLLIATWLWWRAPVVREGVAPAAAPFEALRAPALSVDRATDRATLSLPPQRGPLLPRLAQLGELAAEGHPQAACRLALELNFCRAVRLREVVSQGLESVLLQRSMRRRGEREEQRWIDSIADVREVGATHAAHCAEVPLLEENTAVGQFQRAALAGSLRHRVLAALLQPDGSLPRLPRDAVSPLPMDPWVASSASQFYADHALEFLAQGYRGRDPLALEGLILVHAPDLIHLEAATDVLFRLPDPYRFAGYALLAEQVYGQEMLGSQVISLLQRVLDAMPATERERLQHEVQREAERWLRGPGGLREPVPADVWAALDELCD